MEGNKANIGPTSDAQKIVRSVERIKRLRESLEKAVAKKASDRVASLTEEIDKRTADLEAIKEALSILGE